MQNFSSNSLANESAWTSQLSLGLPLYEQEQTESWFFKLFGRNISIELIRQKIFCQFNMVD